MLGKMMPPFLLPGRGLVAPAPTGGTVAVAPPLGLPTTRLLVITPSAHNYTLAMHIKMIRSLSRAKQRNSLKYYRNSSFRYRKKSPVDEGRSGRGGHGSSARAGVRDGLIHTISVGCVLR